MYVCMYVLLLLSSFYFSCFNDISYKNLKINVLQILFNMMVVRRSILVAVRNIQCLISVIKKKN